MQYGELIIWLELFKAQDMPNVHQTLLAICRPYLPFLTAHKINICTWLYAPTSNSKFALYGLDNTEQLLSGLSTFGSIYDLQSAIEITAKSFS